MDDDFVTRISLSCKTDAMGMTG